MVPQSQLRHWTQGTLSGLEITLIRQACRSTEIVTGPMYSIRYRTPTVSLTMISNQ